MTVTGSQKNKEEERNEKQQETRNKKEQKAIKNKSTTKQFAASRTIQNLRKVI